MTIRTIAQQQQVNPESIQRKIRRMRELMPEVWLDMPHIDETLTEAQIQALTNKKIFMTNVVSVPAAKVRRAAKSVSPQIATATIQAEPIQAKAELPPPPEYIEQEQPQTWLMWCVLILTFGASVPNMYEIAHQIKPDAFTAFLFTACMVLGPLLLLAYSAQVGRAMQSVVTFGAITYEVYCNASTIFGGLTGYANSTTLQPTNFLHQTCSFLNTTPEPTARLIALFVALVIAGFGMVAVFQISKSQTA
jgi:hypothetical protein